MRSDPRPTSELFARVVALDPDDDDRWSIVAVLQWRGTEEVLDAALAALAGDDARARLVAVDVLGQLGVPHRPFRDRSVPALIAALDDPEPAVAGAAGIALGHNADKRAIDPLVAKADHPSVEVRRGVVHGLSGLDDDRAVTALVGLSRDRDPEIRDWATFALGAQIDRADAEVLAALHARVNDPDPDTRAEALDGLARRGISLLD
jgi:HEAT repeat protein